VANGIGVTKEISISTAISLILSEASILHNSFCEGIGLGIPGCDRTF